MTQVSFDAARDFVTIYSPSGVAESVTRLNAHDLIRSNGYQWFSANSVTETAPVVDVLAGLETLADRSAIAEAASLASANPPEVVVVAEDALTEKSPITEDQNKTPLAVLALAVTGTDDITVYLKAFSVEALRTLAAERYNEVIHHRTGIDNVIAKIVELETAKTAAESSEV